MNVYCMFIIGSIIIGIIIIIIIIIIAAATRCVMQGPWRMAFEIL